MGAMVHTCHTRDHLEYCALAADEIERFAGLVDNADPAAPVPTCPDWTAQALIEHTGSVHRWAAHMVANRSPQRVSPKTIDLATPPTPEGLGGWVREGGAILIDACKNADPDDEMWAWGADQHVRFWPRRMLHETTVHRADAEIASGSQPQIDRATAADGIEELLDNLPSAGYFRPRVAELRGDGESIALRSTDSGESWLIRLLPDEFRWERQAPDAEVDVATVGVAAGTADLMLLLYARRPIDDDRFAVVGDDRVLTRWLECSAL